MIRQFKTGLLTWMQLRSVGNSRLVQASVLFPLIGYLILFNDQVSSFLVFRGLDAALPSQGILAWIWSRKLYLLYFGLMSLGVGSLIYSLRCPHLVKKHGDFSDYVRIDGPSLSVRSTRNLAKDLKIYSSADRIFEATEACEKARPDIMHQWYAHLSSQHRHSRNAVSILFTVGFILVSAPSLVSAIKIGGLLLGVERP